MPYLHSPSSGKLSAVHNTNSQMLLVILLLVHGELTIIMHLYHLAVELQVQVPTSGSETVECGVCQHAFLVSSN